MWSRFALVLTVGFWCYSCDAVSVCDEVDVVFVIDTASIVHNEANIIGLMDSIIVNGSSEFSGFSAVSYGHHLPLSADSVLFHLDDTKHIAHRRETQRVVHGELEEAFKSIKDAVKEGGGHTVSVLDAVKHGQTQHSPVAMKRKHELLGEALDYTMGHHDDDTIYIVFDYTNQLLSNGDICKMYQMVDAPRERDHFYFLFGQHLDTSIGVNCHREGGGILNYGEAFHHFDEDRFVHDAQELDVIYDLTCPAMIHSHTYNGHLTLHRNVQWLDPETITDCELYHVNEETKGSVLDPARSFITAKDFAGDGNTFKAMDYLMASPMNHDHIRHKGCHHPTYQIAKVMRSTELHHDPIRQQHYHILKLHVVLPQSPFEFMARADVRGDEVPVDLNQNSKHRTESEDEVRQHHHDGHYSDGGGSRRRLVEDIDKVNMNTIPKKLDFKPTYMRPSKTRAKDVDKFVEHHKGAQGKVVQKPDKEYKLFGVQMSEKYELDFKTAFKGQVPGMKPKTKLGVGVKVKANVMWMIRMESRVSFIFKWESWTWKDLEDLNAFPSDSHLKVELIVGFEARAAMNGYFQVTLDASVEIFRKGFIFTFAIGPVPVVIEPFVKLSAGVGIKLPEIHFNLDYVFAERWHVGYEVDTTEGKRKIGPISQRVKLPSEPMDNKVSVKSPDQPCPIELGVDPKVTPEVGVAFYVLLEGFLKFPITVELTMRFPALKEVGETTDTICVGESGDEPWEKWQMTLWMGVKFGINIGGRIALEKIPYLGDAIKQATPSLSWEIETSLLKGKYLLAPRQVTLFGSVFLKTLFGSNTLDIFPGLKQCCNGDKAISPWKYPRTEPDDLAQLADPGNLPNKVTTTGGKKVKQKWESPEVGDYKEMMQRTEDLRKAADKARAEGVKLSGCLTRDESRKLRTLADKYRRASWWLKSATEAHEAKYSTQILQAMGWGIPEDLTVEKAKTRKMNAETRWLEWRDEMYEKCRKFWVEKKKMEEEELTNLKNLWLQAQKDLAEDPDDEELQTMVWSTKQDYDWREEELQEIWKNRVKKR